MGNNVDVARLHQLLEHNEVRNLLSSVQVGIGEDEDLSLAVLLCNHFDAHESCPDQEVEEGFGWREWAVEQATDVMDRLVDAALAHAEKKMESLRKENEQLREENERVRLSNLDCTRWEKATRFDLMRCQNHMLEQRRVIEDLIEQIEESPDASDTEALTEAKRVLGMAPCMDFVGQMAGEKPTHDSRLIPHGWQIRKNDRGDLVLDEIGRDRQVKVLAREIEPNKGDFLSMIGVFLEDLRTFSALQSEPSDICREPEAFETFAADQKLSLERHPLHYLFLDPSTNLARRAWKAGINYCLKAKSDQASEKE